MLPITTIAVSTPPPALVSTYIPGNQALHVPPANVSPPVSNVEVENNARGNNAAVSTSAQAPANAAASPSFSPFVPSFNGTPTILSLSPQTTFLAQVLSQDGGTEARSVLAEYEKLAAIGNVKYKPSNAGMPEPEPASVFERIVQQEKQVRAVQQQAAAPPQNTAPVAASQAAAAGIAAPKPAPQPRETKAAASDAPAPAASPPRAARAYSAVASRSSETPVEAVALIG